MSRTTNDRHAAFDGFRPAALGAGTGVGATRVSDALRVSTDPLGGGPLAAIAVRGGAPAGWYQPRPTDAEGWRRRADNVRRAAPAWFDALRPAFGAGTARLERVARAGGVVVTTGQQPGLFGGPVYTWSKALSALALADAIESAAGIPAAPVFWAATDDADFAEASVTHVAVRGGLDTLRMPRPATDGEPMARVPLGNVEAILARLAAGAGSGASAGVLEAVARAYGAPAATVGSAYTALLRELLEPLDVAVLDASHTSVRDAGAEVTRRALTRASEVARALATRDEELAAAGFAPQVAAVDGLTLVFALTPDGKKQRITLAGAPRTSDHTPDDAISPNVLLRPVLERAILPTVAYVAGPGELAYFAQVSAVAAALGAPAPLGVPRWSGTIVEPHVARILERLRVEPDALRDPHAADARLARAAMPGELRTALAAAREGIANVVRGVRRAPGGDSVADTVAEGAERALTARLERLERRYVAEFKRRESATMRDVATARAALWPLGRRQERTLNFLPMLARQGPPLLAAMHRRAATAMEELVGGRTAPMG